jgi:hypothetical protein
VGWGGEYTDDAATTRISWRLVRFESIRFGSVRLNWISPDPFDPFDRSVSWYVYGCSAMCAMRSREAAVASKQQQASTTTHNEDDEGDAARVLLARAQMLLQVQVALGRVRRRWGRCRRHDAVNLGWWGVVVNARVSINLFTHIHIGPGRRRPAAEHLMMMMMCVLEPLFWVLGGP